MVWRVPRRGLRSWLGRSVGSCYKYSKDRACRWTWWFLDFYLQVLKLPAVLLPLEVQRIVDQHGVCNNGSYPPARRDGVRVNQYRLIDCGDLSGTAPRRLFNRLRDFVVSRASNHARLAPILSNDSRTSIYFRTCLCVHGVTAPSRRWWYDVEPGGGGTIRRRSALATCRRALRAAAGSAKPRERCRSLFLSDPSAN